MVHLGPCSLHLHHDLFLTLSVKCFACLFWPSFLGKVIYQLCFFYHFLAKDSEAVVYAYGTCWVPSSTVFCSIHRAAEARNRLRIMRLRYQSSRVSSSFFAFIFHMVHKVP